MTRRDKVLLVLSCHERNREKLERVQRVIMFARKRAGMTQTQVAKRIYVTCGTMSCYECGKLKAPWEQLLEVLPELEEMREKGCEAYCKFSEECKDGKCKYRTRGIPSERRGKDEL